MYIGPALTAVWSGAPPLTVHFAHYCLGSNPGLDM